MINGHMQWINTRGASDTQNMSEMALSKRSLRVLKQLRHYKKKGYGGVENKRIIKELICTGCKLCGFPLNYKSDREVEEVFIDGVMKEIKEMEEGRLTYSGE
ncbi:hypothetical protein QJS10_CPA09g00435 [Acorus calamus]|uniref:Uncharacterized protein n=1 Tax=Acorus calamus TaxID=4465 RepID=A0AAV9E7A1_ACOCL|nr:hypothetical protein QJS10_CPA09g00435 [Acorus calamus]